MFHRILQSPCVHLILQTSPVSACKYIYHHDKNIFSGIPLRIIPGITYHHNFGSRKYSKRRRSSERHFSFTGVCVGQIFFLSFWCVVQSCRTCSILAGAVIKDKYLVPSLQMASEYLESPFPVLGFLSLSGQLMDVVLAGVTGILLKLCIRI